MSENSGKPSIFANKYVVAAGGLALFAGVFGLAMLLGPKNRRSRACYETADEFAKESHTPESRARMGHLAYNYEACLDGCDDEDDAYSCGIVAHVYAEGAGLLYEGGVDLELAAKYAQRSCDLAGRTPCIMPARYQCWHDEAACERRCLAGTGDDCVSLAKQIDQPSKDGYDPARALDLHEQACKTGVDESCARAVELLCASRLGDCVDRCTAGEAPMCFQIGEQFSRGSSEVAKDPQKATEFKRRACELDPKVNEDCAKIINAAKIEPC